MMSAVCAGRTSRKKGKRRLPIFRPNKASGAARGPQASPDTEQRGSRTENPGENTRRLMSEQRQQIKSRKRELLRLRGELRSASEKAEMVEHKKSKKRVQQEIFRLKKELRAARQRAKEDSPGRPVSHMAVESATGTLPDFVIIGGKKCGTTSLYHLLTQHPYVEPAAAKELHYFDALFDEGAEWYRQCFPAPRWENGRRTITGEGTPYMTHRLAPERMAQLIPRARLIALLRNPVDRAHSDHQQVVRKGRESRTFEEATEDETSEYLSRGVYVDQLLRWSKFFAQEQMLVLKSEDFFERPMDTLMLVLDFLDLPGWEPEASEVRNRGTYTQEMSPTTRRRLEAYFQPHNRRLYEYLGVDFGW
jgi:hypothetical protein